MLVKISVENFKSFDKMTELTMVSSSKIRSKSFHKTDIKNTHILKHAIIYGANASGKSNLVDFFHFFKSTVRSGLAIGTMGMFCKSQKENEVRESSFEIQITIGDCFYAYGFSAILSQRKITSEWLYELYQTGNSKCLFERFGEGIPKLGSMITLSDTDSTKFKTYSEDFEGNTTVLFLAEMNRNKKYGDDSRLSFFENVYNWITKNIVVLTPYSLKADFEYYNNEDSLCVVNNLISTFDTGISKVRIDSVSGDELKRMVPPDVFKELMNEINENVPQSSEKKFKACMRSNDIFFNIEINGNEEPVITTIRLTHGRSIYDFDFSDESDGTRRIFELLDMIMTKNCDMLFVVDELERSLHPKLTRRFLELFFEFHRNNRVQLIFTTHESSIMDQDIFRRDEIWFVERDSKNASRLYSLDHFKERYDKNLSKAYLEGRYGAIPVFSTFNFKKEDDNNGSCP